MVNMDQAPTRGGPGTLDHRQEQGARLRQVDACPRLLRQAVAERAGNARQLRLHHAREQAGERVVRRLEVIQARADARRDQAALLLARVDDVRDQPMACRAVTLTNW